MIAAIVYRRSDLSRTSKFCGARPNPPLSWANGAPSGFSSFNSESPLTGNLSLSSGTGAGVSSVVASTRVVRKHFAHAELVEICAPGALRTVPGGALWTTKKANMSMSQLSAKRISIFADS